MKSSTLYKVGALVGALALSCSFFEGAVPQASETPDVVVSSPDGATPSSDDGSSDEMEEPTDPRVEGALALRSVQMELQTVFPGETPNRILVSVDAVGNQLIEMTTPMPEGSPATPESPEWNMYEIFIVDGKACTRMGKIGSAEPDLDQNNALSDILYNPMGPGMWLILLPEENFTPAGTEVKGRFDATKYAINGSLGGDAIWGEFWVDEQTGALIGANLSLAEDILGPVESGAGGTVTIVFTVEKADVTPITTP